jgi:hypothetical protein
VVCEHSHAAGVCLFRRADGTGGSQVSDQRAAAGQGEHTGHRGRDGLVHQALHVGQVDPAVVDQYPVRGTGQGFQPDDLGHPAAGHVTVRGGH